MSVELGRFLLRLCVPPIDIASQIGSVNVLMRCVVLGAQSNIAAAGAFVGQAGQLSSWESMNL